MPQKKNKRPQRDEPKIEKENEKASTKHGDHRVRWPLKKKKQSFPNPSRASLGLGWLRLIGYVPLRYLSVISVKRNGWDTKKNQERGTREAATKHNGHRVRWLIKISLRTSPTGPLSTTIPANGGRTIGRPHLRLSAGPPTAGSDGPAVTAVPGPKSHKVKKYFQQKKKTRRPSLS